MLECFTLSIFLRGRTKPARMENIVRLRRGRKGLVREKRSSLSWTDLSDEEKKDFFNIDAAYPILMCQHWRSKLWRSFKGNDEETAVRLNVSIRDKLARLASTNIFFRSQKAARLPPFKIMTVLWRIRRPYMKDILSCRIFDFRICWTGSRVWHQNISRLFPFIF